MRKYRIGIGFNKKAEKELNDLKEFMDKYSPFETVRLEKCPLSLIVETDKYAYLSNSDMKNNINSLIKNFKFPVSNVIVHDYE